MNVRETCLGTGRKSALDDSSSANSGRHEPADRSRGGTLGNWVRRCRGSALNLLFPGRCVNCGGELATDDWNKAPICVDCLARLTVEMGPCCRRCGMPIPEVPTPANDCGRCRDARLYFDRVAALGFYRNDLRETVIRMKQSVHEPLTLAMGRLLADRLREQLSIEPPDGLVPVPIHWTRRIVRGVNVAELLCESLRSSLGLHVGRNVLKCRRKTKKQGTLGPSARIANVRGALAVNASYDLTGANLVLVDDVMTTGATANEAAKMLRRAGAASIRVAVIARGIGT